MNTATRQLAAFPLRVLYRYALLGHSKTYGRKKTTMSDAGG
ncbi:hypothetical protein [Undibacterium danionis]|uniref:Uncharacterized protein n=1 Tax=Undibacterium danionis TaxID=1812100 RepID=A0ABV6IIY8_9BURK